VLTLVRKLAKFRSLSGSQQMLVAAALLQLPAFWIGLHMLGFKRFIALLHRARAYSASPLGFGEIAAIGSLVNSTVFHCLGPNNCLIRSLYLFWLLRRQGVMSNLRIGVRLAGGKLQSHAWVEVAGRPVNDAHDIVGRYVSFDPCQNKSEIVSE
jgi:hypothetical protein